MTHETKLGKNRFMLNPIICAMCGLMFWWQDALGGRKPIYCTARCRLRAWRIRGGRQLPVAATAGQ